MNSAEASCHGKVAHKSYSIAKKALTSYKAFRVRKSGGHIYHCEHCKKYHIGTHQRLIKDDRFKRIERALRRDDEIELLGMIA